MPRSAFPSGRKPLLLLAFAAAIIGGAWWWVQPPAEPVYEGERLSDIAFTTPGTPERVEARAHKIRACGTPAVTWLTYKLEHGSHPFIRHGPLPFDRAPGWLRQRLPESWGGLRFTLIFDERSTAAEILRRLGPEAAPAIPALARSLQSDDSDLVRNAASALQNTGSAAWPVIQDALAHGSKQARIALLEMMPGRFGMKGAGTTEAEAASAYDAVMNATHDPDPQVRATAMSAIDSWHSRTE